MTPTTTDTVIDSRYGEPNTSRNPYRNRAERSTWTEFEVIERADGSRYRREREVSRWAGEVSHGQWRRWDLCEEGLRTRAEVLSAQSAAAKNSALRQPLFILLRGVMREPGFPPPGAADAWAALSTKERAMLTRQTGLTFRRGVMVRA